MIYGRNQLGCEKAKIVEYLSFILWVFLTVYIFVAWVRITIRLSILCHGIADNKAQLSDFKISKMLCYMRYDILKIVNNNSRMFEFDC